MRIALWPFCSQQDKLTGAFRLSTDSTVKYLAYCAERLREAGHDVAMVLPSNQCDSVPWQGPTVKYRMHLSNAIRRLQWPVEVLERLDVDVLWTTHDYLPIAARKVCPGLRIVGEAGVVPEPGLVNEAMFWLSWMSCDIVGCNNLQLADLVAPYARAEVWQFSFHEELLEPAAGERTVDVLFNVRASDTNYSHHREFVEQMRDSGLRVVMCDPTGYLRKTGECPPEWLPAECPLSREAYVELLRSSRVVVGSTVQGGGTHAFREAVACGCIPVALDAPCYTELLTNNWPYLCTPSTIGGAAERAVLHGWASVSAELRAEVMNRVAQCSYAATWERASKSILELVK